MFSDDACDLLCFFFFKQKTAYEMRISDWSSDVCSSDLAVAADQARRGEGGGDHAAACLAERMRADGKGNLATIFARAASTFGFTASSSSGVILANSQHMGTSRKTSLQLAPRRVAESIRA